MHSHGSQVRTKPSKLTKKKPRKLRSYQMLLLKMLNLLLQLWTRTLRFRFGDDARAIIEGRPPTLVAVLWHNRLFAVPEFYRRYGHGRKLAAVISTSSAGAWLSGLFKIMGIKPIRGSRNRRGVQAFREMLETSKSGYDIGITPDGSRGPRYEMKPGAANLALRNGTPIALLSFNFEKAFRLMTWDRFYIPYPFSCVEVQIDFIDKSHTIFSDDPNQAARKLKSRLDGMTRDSDEDFYGEVI